ncbi:hypothetical protein K1719_043351 [Acacia pycnantha]|nr:hypothetical protein K1719_043351 [Acacia pycnantha]
MVFDIFLGIISFVSKFILEVAGDRRSIMYLVGYFSENLGIATMVPRPSTFFGGSLNSSSCHRFGILDL